MWSIIGHLITKRSIQVHSLGPLICDCLRSVVGLANNLGRNTEISEALLAKKYEQHFYEKRHGELEKAAV